MKQSPHTRRTPEQWRKIIMNQEASGETAAAYCRTEGLCKHSFYGWRKQLAVENKSPKNGFVEIKPQYTPPSRVTHIETPTGFRLTIPLGMDAKFVKNILRVLDQT